MDLQEQLAWVRRQRLVVTTPKIEPAERLVERQQAPRPLQDSQSNRRPHWRYKTPENTRKKAKELTSDQRHEVQVLKKYHPDLTYMDLSKWTGFTHSQIQRALTGPLTRRKRASPYSRYAFRCPDRPEICTVEWLPISPDLNPNENVWVRMRNGPELNYNMRSLMSRELKEAVPRAWEAVPDDFLMSLSSSMSSRMWNVRNNGGRQQDY
ncbi:hypothetical protein F4814DRAFT_452671 [Daldinia grandis]|nr:hypothetical protein F4814DRAFT_452671 [Daldinia grandis]